MKSLDKYGVYIESGSGVYVRRFLTGVFMVDYLLGGGLPMGKVVVFWGATASGKSTLALRVVSNVQRMGKRCLWIDVENSYDAGWARTIGVDVESLNVVRGRDAQGILNFILDVAKEGEYDFLVLDSVAVLLPSEESDRLVGEWTQGLLARLLHQFSRKYVSEVMAVKRENTPTLLIINQERERIIQFGNPTVKPGGKALEFLASVEIRFSKGKMIEDKDKNEVAVEYVFNVTKNRYFRPNVEGSYRMVVRKFGTKEVGEIWDEPQVLELMKQTKFLVREGNQYRFEGVEDVRFPTQDTVKDYFYQNKQFYEEIKLKFLNYLIDNKIFI